MHVRMNVRRARPESNGGGWGGQALPPHVVCEQAGAKSRRVVDKCFATWHPTSRIFQSCERVDAVYVLPSLLQGRPCGATRRWLSTFATRRPPPNPHIIFYHCISIYCPSLRHSAGEQAACHASEECTLLGALSCCGGL